VPTKKELLCAGAGKAEAGGLSRNGFYCGVCGDVAGSGVFSGVC